MPVTVADILKLPVMASAKVMAGHAGLCNSVRWVHVTEMLDIARLLNGGEMVLTTGITLDVSPGEQRAFVMDLRRIGCAALGIELVRRFRSMPPALVAAADEAGLPVIAFFEEIPFVQVTEAAHTLIVNRQYALIREAESVATALNHIALNQQGVTAILQGLARAIDNPVLCLPASAQEAPLMYPPGVIPDGYLPALRSLAGDAPVHAEHRLGGRTGRPVRVLSLPISLGPGRWGNLVIPELHRRLTDMDTLVVDRAAVTVAFELLRQESMREQWRMSTGELLEDILAGSFRHPQELEFRARELGLDLGAKWFTVLSLQAVGAADRAELMAWLRTAVAQLGLTALMAGRGDRVRLLLAAPDGRTLSERLARLLARLKTPAGAGSPFQDLRKAQEGLEQAEYTLELQLAFPDGRFGPLFESTGTYRLLLSAIGKGELERFATEELGPLLHLPAAESRELLQTLRVLLDLGANMAETARQLKLSRQAVYYRKERLEGLLGPSLLDPERSLSLGLALRALDLVRLRPQSGGPA